MGIVAWIIMGLVVGAIATMIMKEGGGWGFWVSSIIFGIIGGIVGGWIGDLLFNHGAMSIYSPLSWILAVVGACLVIWIYKMVTRGSRRV